MGASSTPSVQFRKAASFFLVIKNKENKMSLEHSVLSMIKEKHINEALRAGIKEKLVSLFSDAEFLCWRFSFLAGAKDEESNDKWHGINSIENVQMIGIEKIATHQILKTGIWLSDYLGFASTFKTFGSEWLLTAELKDGSVITVTNIISQCKIIGFLD